MVGQTPVRVEDGEVGAADVAHAQLLVAGRARVLGDGLEVALLVLLLGLEGFGLGQLGHGLVDAAGGTEVLDFLHGRVVRGLDLADFAHLRQKA
jgi:hypothetical protein